MRAESFIAKRLYFSPKGGKEASRPAIKIALAGIIIGVAVMILTLCIVVGFKQTITQKIAGFGAHIQVTSFENNNTYELSAIEVTDSLMEQLASIPHIRSAHRFLTKPGILKTDDAFRGIVLKGTSYWDYFDDNLLCGTVPRTEQQVLVSKQLADWLHLQVDSSFYCYFVGERLSVRKLCVSGIYTTGFGEFDGLFVLGQEQTVRRLNGWSDSLASGIELLVDDWTYLDETADRVYFATVNNPQEDGTVYCTQTIGQLNPQIFAWLDLLDMNVIVIILLMLCVSGFNIVSGLIILILDSVGLIGMLKAMGATNRFVRRVFITQAAMLVGKGMLWGNVIGLALALLQYLTHWIPLDAATYYVSYVPMAFPVWGLVLLNAGTMALSVFILLAPSAIVTKISPAKVLQFG
ncbi:MAG: ABC transporter permease [Paludibacteraceae bacterium]|nr:ABC transporter permease [Paludibacteraceae bacterium]